MGLVSNQYCNETGVSCVLTQDLTFNPGGKLDVTRQRLVLGHLAGLVGVDVDFPSASLFRQRRRGVARTIRSRSRYSGEAAGGDYT
jgi:hypothetical protein